jgi:DNA-binding transcriptional ArsR family regulator
VDAPRKRYSNATAEHVISTYRDLERIDDVVTISAISRRSGVSRSTVRAVLRQECGWTLAQSRCAHRAGVRRGKLLQAVAGHPGLAKGRETLQLQGWPNLQRGQQALLASDYSALKQGRVTQASCGWPGLMAAHGKLAATGYLHLTHGRANLAARGWPNWKKAQTVLESQDYLPLLDAQRLRTNGTPLPLTDRRVLRGRTTRLAVLQVLQELRGHQSDDLARDGDSAGRSGGHRMTARMIADTLHLHPTTVYGHLKQLRAQGIIE